MSTPSADSAIDHVDQIIELCTGNDFTLVRHDGAREGGDPRGSGHDTLVFKGHEQPNERINFVDVMINMRREMVSDALFRIQPAGKQDMEHVTTPFSTFEEFRTAYDRFLQIVHHVDQASDEEIAGSSGLRFFVIDQLKSLLALSKPV